MLRPMRHGVLCQKKLFHLLLASTSGRYAVLCSNNRCSVMAFG